MNKWKEGIVAVSNNMIIHPGYTFEEFKNTIFYLKQDGVRIIYLDEKQIIDGKQYIVGLFFRRQKIYMLSLICCDGEYDEKSEINRKKLHDDILNKYEIMEQDDFKWGKIRSEYDARSNISSINFYYVTT